MQIRPATKITLIHIAIGLIWIYLGDTVLYLLFDYQDEQRHTIFQYIKGGVYILVTGGLLYLLTKSFSNKAKARVIELETKQQELFAIQKASKTGNWEYDTTQKKVIWSFLVSDLFEIGTEFQLNSEYLLINHLKDSLKRPWVIQQLQDAEEKGRAFDIEVEVITAKGAEKWIRLVGKPIMENGKCIKVFGSFQDITASKTAELKILQLNRLSNFIRGVNKAILRISDPDSLLKEVCEIAVNIGQFKMAWIGRSYNNDDVIPFISAGDNDAYLANNKMISLNDMPEGQGPSGIALRELRHVVCNDLETNPMVEIWRAQQRQRGYKSSIAIPIVKSGTVFGVFTLYSPLQNFFDSKEVEMLLDLTDDIAYALENINKEGSRKLAETSLVKSEEKYRHIVETANEGIWIINENGLTSFTNKQLDQMLGYEPDEMMGKQMFDFMDASSKNSARENLQKRKNGSKEILDFSFRKKDGTILWAQINISPLQKSGKYIGFLIMVTDITNRKEAEAKIAEALERYDMVARATSDTIWDWDIKKDTITYNQGISNVFGYSEKEISNSIKWWEKNVHKSNRDLVKRTLHDTFVNQEQLFQIDYRFRCMDGTYKYVIDRAFVTYDTTDKPIRVIGTMQDVTKEIESEAKIENAVTNMQEQERQQIGMELHDNVNQILAVSLLYLGLTKDAMVRNLDASALFSKTEQYIKDATDEVRRLSHELAPVSFNDFSIKQVFDILIETLNVHKTFNITTDIVAIDKSLLPIELKINLYRILQEQLNNIIKYAGATEIFIGLSIVDNSLKLTIKDNGKGFDPKTTSKGIGMENMKRRAKLFSGTFKVNTLPDKGCEIIIEIPLNKTDSILPIK